jgi:hypothetical protein
MSDLLSWYDSCQNHDVSVNSAEEPPGTVPRNLTGLFLTTENTEEKEDESLHSLIATSFLRALPGYMFFLGINFIKFGGSRFRLSMGRSCASVRPRHKASSLVHLDLSII